MHPRSFQLLFSPPRHGYFKLVFFSTPCTFWNVSSTKTIIIVCIARLERLDLFERNIFKWKVGKLVYWISNSILYNVCTKCSYFCNDKFHFLHWKGIHWIWNFGGSIIPLSIWGFGIFHSSCCLVRAVEFQSCEESTELQNFNCWFLWFCFWIQCLQVWRKEQIQYPRVQEASKSSLSSFAISHLTVRWLPWLVFKIIAYKPKIKGWVLWAETKEIFFTSSMYHVESRSAQVRWACMKNGR